MLWSNWSLWSLIVTNKKKMTENVKTKEIKKLNLIFLKNKGIIKVEFYSVHLCIQNNVH